MRSVHEILKEYWGYDSFRLMQEDIINSVLAGNDTLAVLPTGGGKSICFQVPAMATEGICIVVSPLIALIKDQVQNLKSRGINALAVYSGMRFHDIRRTLQNAAYGNFKFLYISPERLETDLFREYVAAMKVNLLAIDEAHCISQWGYDFRPSYLRIAAVREQFPNVPVLALTASATAEVQDDIIDKLQFSNTQQRFQKTFERANLSYSVFHPASKENKLVEVLQKVNGSAIVYCKSRKRTTEVASLLNMHGLKTEFYHAGLDSEKRSSIQDRWIKNEVRIIASTNAFGMGIDKPDVRVVVHYDVPDCLENYYQEAGRAGRDEKKAYAVLLYSQNELKDLSLQSDVRFPTIENIREVYKALMNYLQVAAGVGEEQTFDFDLVDFCKRFKLDNYKTLHALKALEQEGLLIYHEQYFQDATVVFTCSRLDLEQIARTDENCDKIIKTLLRSYEGIYDYPAQVNESQLASLTHLEKEAVRELLKKLDHSGIIEYAPIKDKPQIRLLENRVVAADLQVNYELVRHRKAAFEKRLQMMLNYVKSEFDCRSRMIGLYFNDVGGKDCGVCDNCLRQKNLIIGDEEFRKIKGLIEQVVGDRTIQVNELLQNRGTISTEKMWKVINRMVAEELISSPEHGQLRFKNVQGKKKGPR
jgi:ATP-dependent DNA helicase RecQ